MQVFILNNTLEVTVDLVKLPRKKFVHYEGKSRNQYSFVSPFTGTTWVIQPEGYSSHFQSQFWAALWIYQPDGNLCSGTFGLGLKDAIVKALQSEKGVYQ